MRVLIAITIVLGACFETHDPMNQAVAQDDCYTCHVPEYNATGTSTYPLSPPHAAANCGTQCAQCHTTQQWHNGLGNDLAACTHPEDKFPLSTQGTQHTNIKCLECHSTAISDATGFTSVKGANTDCIACHPNTSTQANDHVGVTYDAGTLIGQPYAYSNSDHRFCLDCHPKGLPAGHDPSNPFALPHHGSPCASCHDNASGLGHQNGKDVTCVGGGCHRTHNDPPSGTGVHVGTIPAGQPSCIAAGCHWDGRKHDNG